MIRYRGTLGGAVNLGASYGYSGKGKRLAWFDGLPAVIGNLNQRVAAIKHYSVDGMWEVVFIVEAASKPLCPVATGNLISSWFGYVRQIGEQIFAEVGYGASYALPVHEIDKHYKKPGAQWKYLEAAINQKISAILGALRRSAARGI